MLLCHNIIINEEYIMSTVETTIKRLIAEQLSIGSDFSNEKTFAELGADSLDAVEIIMAMEDEFQIVIEDDNAEDIKTVQSAIDYIEKLLK